MATVTKLKAAVNNKNLPILGEDGYLYNYYVGRYRNKLSELGYNLTQSEINALNEFINVGINDGWIDKVGYLLPFIGNEDNPLTGIVPLIDQVSDYELAEEEVNAKLFSYSNGKIVCMGGRNDNSNIHAKLPLNTSQLGFSLCFSPYWNVTLDSGTITDGIKGISTYANDTDSVARFTCRKGSSNKNYFYYGIRVNPEDSPAHKEITATNFDSPCNAGIFLARYYNDNQGENRFKTYVIVKDESTPRRSDMTGTSETSVQMPILSSPCDIYIGSNFANAVEVKYNIMAFMKPNTLTKDDMYSFNQAVFALITALDRDVPTT